MSNELRQQIYKELSLRETEDLLEIWQTNDRGEWSDIAFEAIKEILGERLGEVPPQAVRDEPEEGENVEDDGLAEWETKLLDDENQPEFYDTLEVLSLKDNINKVAIGAIIVYALQGLLRLQIVATVLRGIPLSSAEALDALPGDLYTILVFGLQIALTYFPLKALSHILRILMEMEFRSRKAS